MNNIKKYHYDGLLWLQCLVLFIKSVVFLTWVKELASKNAPWDFFQTIYAFPLHLPLYLAVLSFVFLTKRKKFTGYLLNMLFSFLIFIDLIYFRAFGLPTSWFSLSGLSNLGEVGNSIAGLIHPIDFLLFADLIVWGIIYAKHRKMEGWITPVRWSRFGLYLSLSMGLGYMEYSQDGLMQKILTFRYKPLYAIEKIGPIGYHVADSVNYVKDYSNSTLNEKQKNEVKQWFEQNKALRTASWSPSEYKGKFKNKNVIYIHFESLENFPIRKTWNHVEITPNLNRLLSKSLYFSNLKEQVGEGNSADAEFILFNSLYPLPQGIVSLRYPTDHYYSFPRELRDHGYETAAFVGMEKAFMNMGVMLPKYGFKEIHSITSFQYKEKLGLGLADAEMFPQAMDRIRTLPKPFFAYLITLTNHVPYYLPSTLQNKELSKGINNQRVRSYLQTVHYVDQALGEFLKKFHESGLEKDTILVIYGDHEGINKYYSKDVESSGLDWVKNNKTVPLIIYHPSIAGKEKMVLGGQVDILPTIEYLLGMPQDNRTLYRVGRNLLSEDRPFAILHNGDYMGSTPSENEGLKPFRLRGREMSLKVIQSDLFKQIERLP